MMDDLLEKQIRSIERKGNDIVSLISDLDASFFSTSELLKLYGIFITRQHLSKKINKFLFVAVLISPVWLLLSLAAHQLLWRASALFFLRIFPLSFILFIVGQVVAKYTLGGIANINSILKKIVIELKKRQGKFHSSTKRYY